MKATSLFVIAFQFLAPEVTAQWIQTSGPHGATVLSVAAGNNYQFAGTWNGVYRTTTGGTIWESVDLKGKSIHSLLVDGMTVYAGTNRGVYKSSDNGGSWDSTGLVGKITTTLATNDSLLFAGTTNGLFVSADGGIYWHQIDTGLTSKNVTVFAGGMGGILVGTLYDGLYKSTNDGTTWIRTNFPENTIFALTLAGTTLLASSWDNVVYRSTDIGFTWTTHNIGPNSTGVKAFANTGSEVFAGTNSGVYKSLDDGLTWFYLALQSTYIYDLTLAGSNIIAGSNLGAYQSSNGGSTWSQVNAGLLSAEVRAFATSGSRLFAGTFGFGVQITTDNGSTWLPYSDGLSYPLVTGLGVHRDSIYAGTLAGIFRSSAISPSWTNVTPGFDAYGSQTFLFAGSTILAPSFNGIVRSTNDGATWQRIDSIHISNSYYQAWALIDIGSALIAGYNQRGIRISTDNGASWNYSNEGIGSITVNALTQIGQNVVLGTTGIGVFFSSNGGANWTQSNLTTSQVNTFFVTGNIVLSGGSSGVFRSTDQGLNWTSVSEGLPSGVRSLSASGEYLFAGMQNSSVWRRPLSEITSVHNPTLDEALQSFALFQNYPNPFNSETVIGYRIPQAGVTRLRIYDLIGRLIGTLVDQHQTAGDYRVNFDARNLPSGAYFYRLQSGANTATKVLLLTK